MAFNKRITVTLAMALTSLCPTGCGTSPPQTAEPSTGPDVTATLINVTPFDVSIVLSGIRTDEVDTVERVAGTTDTAEVTFVCIDELVIGDPLNPERPGVIIDPEGLAEEIPPFSILEDESFFCGDLVEIIVSGNDPDAFVVDVFAFTAP